MTSTRSAQELHLRALGLPVTLRLSGNRVAELQEMAEDSWRDCLTAPREPEIVIDVRLDDDTDQQVDEGRVWDSLPDRLMDRLSPVVTVAAITRQAGRLLMLHACGLADPTTGRAVALVAPSGTGKTTLARTLMRHFDYVSDETVAVTLDGSRRVVAYPKPLSLLSRTGSPLKEQVAASRLGARASTSSPVLAGVFFLERDPDGPRLEVEPVRNVQALVDLTPQVSFLARLPAPLHAIAGCLSETGGLRRVRYREATDLRDVIAEAVS